MIVCVCQAVSDRELEQAIDEGARTVPDLVRVCGAGGDCGGCHDMLLECLQRAAGDPCPAAQAASGAAQGSRAALRPGHLQLVTE